MDWAGFAKGTSGIVKGGTISLSFDHDLNSVSTGIGQPALQKALPSRAATNKIFPSPSIASG
jgi:hypothetical protein